MDAREIITNQFIIVGRVARAPYKSQKALGGDYTKFLLDPLKRQIGGTRAKPPMEITVSGNVEDQFHFKDVVMIRGILYNSQKSGWPCLLGTLVRPATEDEIRVAEGSARISRR
jgi:hypothetical protein